MPRFKDHAIVLRHLDWSETSQLVVLLTREHGKRRGLAKGSQRLSPSAVQRFSGGLELLTLGQVVAHAKAGQGLANITEWDLQDDHWFLRRNLPALRLAMYAADVADALLPEDDSHPATFDALRAFLNQLRDQHRPADHASALLRYHWLLLCDAGYQPDLDSDVHTSQPLPLADAYTFDPHAGGLTMRASTKDWRVRASTVETLRAVVAAIQQPDSKPMPTPDDSAVTRANRLIGVYLRHLLGRELPTMQHVLTENA